MIITKLELGKYNIVISNSELDMLQSILFWAKENQYIDRIQSLFAQLMYKQIDVKYIPKEE